MFTNVMRLRVTCRVKRFSANDVIQYAKPICKEEEDCITGQETEFESSEASTADLNIVQRVSR